MKLLFVADPLTSFKTYKDSTFAMMREAARRGHELLACQPQDVMWQRGGRVTACVREITLTGDAHDWFVAKQKAPHELPVALADIDAVVMRKDPALRQRVFLRHPPAAPGRARRRSCVQQTGRTARPP